MVDAAKSRFPEDMAQGVRFPDIPAMESFASNALDRAKQYARDEPMSFALWAFGVGFVIGWRLKPW